MKQTDGDIRAENIQNKTQLQKYCIHSTVFANEVS
jgi:hypothetical protein